MQLRASDAFMAGMTPAEQHAVRASEPRDYIVTGTMLGRFYRAQIYHHGTSVGVGHSPTCAVLAIADAMEKREAPIAD